MPKGGGARDTKRRTSDAAAQRRIREGAGGVERTSKAAQWWRVAMRCHETNAIDEAALVELLEASKGWDFRDLEEATAIVNTAIVSHVISGATAARLQSGLRLVQTQLIAGLAAPGMPAVIALPWVDARLLGSPAELVDDLRAEIEEPGWLTDAQ